MSHRDPIDPDRPRDDGLVEPELPQEDVEPARLLANEARGRLRRDGFTDSQIEGWARCYFEEEAEGDVEGLIRFIEREQAAGRDPHR